jgi:ATP-dependent Clp protease ATP-binding subunit ClpA
MSEYMEKHSVSKIIGAPPGYVGYDEAGQLTEKIRRNPYSVILFDEIEKAHADVLNILLQVLDEGKLTDASGRKVNFENCIIVMTTNAGSGKGSSVSGFTETASRVKEEKTERALAEFLRPEFINRIDEIITFNNLSKADFENIACIMMEQLKSVLTKKGIKLEYSSAVLKHIAENAFSEKYGARNMRRFIERNIEDPLASKIIAAQGEKIQQIRLEVDKDAIQISCE